ncbi:MAG: hypothetical protein R2991_06085 [Thermoanaerobaculia bacterium]
MTRFLCNVVVGLLVAGAAAAEPEIFPLDEVEPGLQGTGLSVFRGDTPEPFGVEVLGVWRDVSPGSSYILARLTGQGLDTSGVIAGMSGSPVYVGDRLLGAVAFSWPYAQEPIAGITPIETMRQLDSAEPLAPVAAPVPPPAIGLLTGDRLPESLLLDALGGLTARPLQGGSSGLLWSLSGFGEWSRDLLARGLQGGVAAAGRADDSGAGDLEAGDAVAAVLVDGDLRLAATGTVTERSADRILAFGHPFLGLGDLRVPMARAEVVTVVPSRAVSFKLANTGDVVGAFDLDRSPGIRGRIGLTAPTIPVTVSIRGSRQRDFSLRVGSRASAAGSDLMHGRTSWVRPTRRSTLRLARVADPGAEARSPACATTRPSSCRGPSLARCEPSAQPATLASIGTSRTPHEFDEAVELRLQMASPRGRWRGSATPTCSGTACGRESGRPPPSSRFRTGERPPGVEVQEA